VTSVFAVGTGRCGTHLVAALFDHDETVVSRHEAHPLEDALHRYRAWNGLPSDDAALVERKRRAIEAAGIAAYLEASAYLSLAVPTLRAAFGSRFLALARDPVDTVNSLWVKGWYDEGGPGQPHHVFSRLMPADGDLERWHSLTRIGKLAWYWRVLNERMLAELEPLPDGHRLLIRLEQLDLDAYRRVAELADVAPRLTPAAFEAVLARRPGAGPVRRDASSWSRRERSEFRREVGDLPDRLGYGTPSRHRPRQLQHLFLVDVKRRLINNTPYDVYKLADRFAGEPVDVVDLRFYDDVELPPSDHAHLFLETAGTWMCFDWDPGRFARRLDSLLARYPRVTVVGPQARALRELTGGPFDIVDTVDFGAVLGNGHRHGSLSGSWLETARDSRYNGQWFDGDSVSLGPTFSISHTMSCPLGCSFCYYAAAARAPKPEFVQTLADVERARGHGHRNFYFMDPNFLRSSAELEQLRRLYERTDGDFAYYCQVSPNFLTEARLEQLAASGCRGMVVGIENRSRIAEKGSIEQARDRVERVREHGMMPTLFFMLDGENDVDELVGEFTGIPFRYTVLNDAFAGDRSLASIEAGFREKRLRAAAHRETIARLERLPDFLGPLRATAGAVS
jgi:hypothetical protein